MAWRVARSLDVLLGRINQLAPARSRASDGSIGDTAHAWQGSASDHNPWYVLDGMPIVTARDFTQDPAHGADMGVLTERLRQSLDRRIKYVIYNRRIFSGPAGPAPFVWRTYSGSDPHTNHAHVSVVASRLCDDTSPWAISPAAPAPTPTPVPDWTTELIMSLPTLQRGANGHAVANVQALLNTHGYELVEDGDFGPKTGSAVRNFQARRQLTVDEIVGPQTYRSLLLV